MRKTPHGHTPTDADNRIREFRNAARLSLQELAASAGTTYQTLQRWETTGKIPVKKLKKLAEALGVTPSDLLPGSEAPRVSELTDEQLFLLQRFETATPETRKAIMRSVKGLTDRDDEPFTVRPPQRPKAPKR